MVFKAKNKKYACDTCTAFTFILPASDRTEISDYAPRYTDKQTYAKGRVYGLTRLVPENLLIRHIPYITSEAKYLNKYVMTSIINQSRLTTTNQSKLIEQPQLVVLIDSGVCMVPRFECLGSRIYCFVMLHTSLVAPV